MDYAKIKELLDQLNALMAGSAAAPPQVTYPALVAHKGVTYNLNAPLAADYEPSQIARIMGGLPGYFVSDPSNAPSGYPNRSPAGYPLFYPIGGDGKPAGQPRVAFGENTFANDAEIEAWMAAVVARDANLAARGDTFSPGRPKSSAPGDENVPIGKE